MRSVGLLFQNEVLADCNEKILLVATITGISGFNVFIVDRRRCVFILFAELEINDAHYILIIVYDFSQYLAMLVSCPSTEVFAYKGGTKIVFCHRCDP